MSITALSAFLDVTNGLQRGFDLVYPTLHLRYPFHPQRSALVLGVLQILQSSCAAFQTIRKIVSSYTRVLLPGRNLTSLYITVAGFDHDLLTA